MQLSVMPDFALQRGQSHLDDLRNKRKDPAAELARLQAAAKEFEAIMMEFMVKSMRANVPESPLFGHDNGREIFNEMLDTQYAHLLADRGGLGLAKMLVGQLGSKIGNKR
jgi:peptidoglycan hydrolase FlgJ